MGAVKLQVISSVSAICSKNSLFNPANTYGRYIASWEHCIAYRDDKMYFLPTCRYHIVLIGDTKELPQKMDAFCFKNQHVDCLYTLFKYESTTLC